MPVVRLDKVADVRLGRQRSPANHAGTQMRPYVRAANVGWGGLRLDDVKQMNFTDAEMTSYRLEPGDLLVSEASGSAKEVGKAAIWTGEIADCAFQNTLIRVRPHGADARYLLHFLRHQAESGQFASLSRGVGIHHLGRQALAERPVPLPPIAEQRRIAAALDETDQLRAKRRQALALLDTLIESIFLDMFGELPGELWPIVRFGDLISDARLGLVRASADLVAEGRYPYMRMNAIDRGGLLDLSSLRRTAATREEVSRYGLRRGDLLFNTRNTRELVGKAAIYTDDETCLFNNNLMRVRFTPEANSTYIWAALRRPALRHELEIRKSGTTSVFAIYAKDLKTVSISLPPIDLQTAFARAIDQLAVRRDKLRRAQTTLDDLFSSLQQRAFRGEL